MRELAGMYTHRMDVYRYFSMESGNKMNESGELLYENVPVRASKQTGLSGTAAGTIPGREEEIGNVVRRYVLFHGTGILLQAGDEVRLRKDGREIYARASDSLLYENHAETMIEEIRAV